MFLETFDRNIIEILRSHIEVETGLDVLHQYIFAMNWYMQLNELLDYFMSCYMVTKRNSDRSFIL